MWNFAEGRGEKSYIVMKCKTRISEAFPKMVRVEFCSRTWREKSDIVKNVTQEYQSLSKDGHGGVLPNAMEKKVKL